ncbi:NACHT, LRR and PYD domains-containing protein 12-like [Alosa alosa]|nr:NACHT, LRR and PYD domains-containing protein 12-like [Alosa alosa]
MKTHKASLKSRFEKISEGISKQGDEILLKKIYTQLYITEGESEGVNKEHEVWQLESASRSQSTEDTSINCNDIFKASSGQEKHIRTVMTKGVAGIGKTVSVQKFILDWTDSGANQDVDFMFPLSFRELNLVRGGQYSLHSLLLDFHPELKELNDSERYKDCQVVFIFDGFDESRLTLDLEQSSKLSDVKQTSSVDLLMTSLIQGTLLPSALIWITSRPAAASQIPAQYINQLTEIRGFNDPQKEEYFRKRISDESQANRIILHIKATRSLYIMCHIPVFCWIAATVLQQMLEQDNTQEIPRTLTEMFIHFLLIQTTRKNQKYQRRCETNSEKLLESHKHVILKLADLAYKHLLQGNLMFYDEDLRECGIEVSEASVYSGVFTEIFKEESVFHQKKIYSFVHLSIQEFLAALHVFLSFKNMNEKLSAPELFVKKAQLPLEELLKKAADKALQSKNGHLDLFLRFLMGISLEKNHRLLQGLLTHPLNSLESIRKTCKYIKDLNREDISPERCINLFHCLFEMNDHSIHEDIQEYLQSPKDFKGQLSPTHCSVLAHMLLMSDEVLDEFDLRTYNTSDEGRRRLIPAVRCFRKARLADCKLSKVSYEIVVSVLQSPNSLIELDLSNNDLRDSGVQLFSAGLYSPKSKLQILRLSGCNLSNESLEIIASVLQSPNSLIVLDLSNNDLKDAQHQLLSAGMHNPNCKLQTLRLTGCNLSDDACEIVASVLQSSNSLIELDLSNNILRDSGAQSLSAGLYSHNCKLQTLRLAQCQITENGYGYLAIAFNSNSSHLKELDLDCNLPKETGLLSARLQEAQLNLKTLQLPGCNLTDKACGIVASVLQSPNSLIELDLSNNDLGDSGVQLLSAGLSSSHCKLQILRLPGCNLSAKFCEIALQSPNFLIELDLSNNNLGDSGVKCLSEGMHSPNSKLQILRLPGCNLSDESCRIVTSVLQSSNSLTELDLSLNDLRDSGAQYLSAGLYSHNCKLQTLRLAQCHITENGYGYLAIAFNSNSSHLKELDLDCNLPMETGLLSARLQEAQLNLKTLQLPCCNLTDKSCGIVASVLQSPNSLVKLDLSNNGLGDSGVQLLSAGLCSSHCKLQILRLVGCNFSCDSWGLVASILESLHYLTELDLSNNVPEEPKDAYANHFSDISKVIRISNGNLKILRLAGCNLNGSWDSVALILSLKSLTELDLSNNDLGNGPYDDNDDYIFQDKYNCRLQIFRLAGCKLSYRSWGIVLAILKSLNSLTELDLSNNGPEDDYYDDDYLSDVLGHIHVSQCHLQILRLAGCNLNYGSCKTLVSVLKSSKPLIELDLSNNAIGNSGTCWRLCQFYFL